MPTTNGTLGLFTLETGEMLESGWSFSAYGNRFTRMPGYEITRDPRAGGSKDLTQADQLHIAGGFILFPAKRIRFC
jgi:hypothetical protein